MNCGESLEKDNTWKSETKMLQEWTWEELQAHLGSGRILWKEDEYTPGVYVYKDTQSWKRLTTAKRNKKWQMGQEQERDDENLGKFKQLYDQEALALGTSASSWEGNTAAIALKGLGKGKSLGKGKGLVKGEDGNADDPPPPQEDPEKEAQEAEKKARKGRDAATAAVESLEEALGKAKKKLSPKGRSTALGLLEQLRGCIAQLKDVLGKGPNQRPKPSKIKSMLTDLAVVMKAAKEEGKELMTLARKAESVAPSAASSKRSKK